MPFRGSGNWDWGIFLGGEEVHLSNREVLDVLILTHGGYRNSTSRHQVSRFSLILWKMCRSQHHMTRVFSRNSGTSMQ